MPTALLVFEFIGTSELMIIAVVALIIFGPRKLPEIGRSLGRSLGEFKRASEDFKRTWEYEVELEQRSPAQTHAAAGGAEGVSGAVGAGELDAGGPIARGSSWHEDEAAVSEAPADFEAGAAPLAQAEAPAQYDEAAAAPGAHGPQGEDLNAHPDDAAEPHGPRQS